MKSTISSFLGAFTLAAFLPGLAVADAPVLAPGDKRASDVTFYLFAPVSTTGVSTVAGQAADVDMNLSEALDVLDFTISGRYETWQGPLGLIVEGNYLGISDDAAVTFSGPIGLGLDVEVESEQFWLSAMAGYRFGGGTTAEGNRYAFDVSGGLRYQYLRQEIDIRGPLRTRDLGGSESWFEPVIGARATAELGNDWTTAFLVDASGFGVEDNDLALSLSLAFSKPLGENSALRFGYRYYSIDFETEKSDGLFAYDVEQHGPFIGFGFSF